MMRVEEMTTDWLTAYKQSYQIGWDAKKRSVLNWPHHDRVLKELPKVLARLEAAEAVCRAAGMAGVSPPGGLDEEWIMVKLKKFDALEDALTTWQAQGGQA